MSEVRNFSENSAKHCVSGVQFLRSHLPDTETCSQCGAPVGELYPRHEKQTKNPAETTGNRYKIEILMSQTQKLKGLVTASLRLKTLNDNP